MKKAVLFLISFILYGGALALCMCCDVWFQEGNEMLAVMLIYAIVLLVLACGCIPVKKCLKKRYDISPAAYNACVIAAAAAADFGGWIFISSLTSESFKSLFPDGGFLVGLGLGLLWLESLAGTALLIIVIIVEAVVKAVIMHKNKSIRG